MSLFGSALIAQLDSKDIQQLADLLMPLWPVQTQSDGWMTTREAADYLGITVDALHKHTQSRAIPFAQDTPGGKCWFQRHDLDEWRRG